MAKPIDAARYETIEASFPSYDDMLHMMEWQYHNGGSRLWVDDVLDDSVWSATEELANQDWRGLEESPTDRHAI